MSDLRCYIHTIGCQMNVYDSEQILARLSGLGYRQVNDPESADLVVLNTCAIREKAEQKVYSFLGRQAKQKKRRPEMILAVGGCVAQQEGADLLERLPQLDLVFGTHALERLPAHLEQIRKKGSRIVDVQMTETPEFFGGRVQTLEGAGPTRFVTIMQGCDNYCTYCVVPHVRGREASRPPSQILAEIRQLVAGGVREVTLLGQNVNSYGAKEGLESFAGLLSRVNDIDALARIRFTTSHPKDLSEELIGCFGSLDKLCRHIHLPVQSGSNRILKRMNRRYTREKYLEKVDRLRRVCPEIAITSDFIVGFPGETDADFAETLALMQAVEFDGVFAFQYSDRPSAPASRFGGKLAGGVKKERLAALLALQEKTTLRKNRALEGSVQQVMAEGPSKKDYRGSGAESPLWTGRTTHNRIVHFPVGNPAGGRGPTPGDLLNVRIEKAFSHSLRGAGITERPAAVGRKGVDSHAA
jgi:tRNA-2-methylthio-N6-dimethylallyladenosine synthase